MLIDTLIEELNKRKDMYGNVEVRAVAPMNSGFLEIQEVLHRKDYHDETGFGGTPLRKGNFISIEWE